MKSPMIQAASYITSEDKKNYSDMGIMKSAAGYYIGTIYNNPDGFQEPGSRDSHYFATYQEAANELELLKKGKSELVLRTQP